MIYQTPEQIRHWPRIMAAAQPIDPALTAALRELRDAGAQLEDKGGRLALSEGRMDPAQYAQIRAEKLLPRKERMATIQTNARAASHPWAAALQIACTDIMQRCERGEMALRGAVERKQTAAIQQIAPVLLDRRWQAQSIANCLYRAGYLAYAKYASDQVGPVMELYKLLLGIGIPYELQAPRPWPVQMPDGWLWLVDVPNVGSVAPVDLGGQQGTKTKLTDEPILTDWDLGDALAPLETSGWWQEAV